MCIRDRSKVARIAPASVRDAALDLINGTEAEAVFLSCTNLQTLDIIVEIEEATGRPALSSNLVLGWHMLKLSNRQFDGSNFGRLMQI